MQPTLLDGDKVWVNKLAYDVKIPFTEISLAELSDPNRGDVVIIDSKKADKRLVKRIVGVPGDTVYMQNNALVINGEAANYEVLSRDDEAIIILEELPDKSHQARLSNRFVSRTARSYGPSEVPEGQYFVLGDNRDNSADSRVYSFVPREEIIGRSNSVVFSLDSDNNYMPRGERPHPVINYTDLCRWTNIDTGYFPSIGHADCPICLPRSKYLTNLAIKPSLIGYC